VRRSLLNMSKLLEKLIDVFRAVGFARKMVGLAGQLMAFFAMMMPILSRNFDSLSFLLVVSAISNLAVIPFSIACGHIVPSLKSPRRVRVALQGAIFVSIGMVLIVVILSAALLAYQHKDAAYIFISAALFTLAQVAYSLVLAILVRSQEEKSIFKLRFIYGASLMTMTGLAVLSGGSGERLIAAYILSTLLSVFLIRDGRGLRVAGSILLNLGAPSIGGVFLIKRYFVRYWPVVFGNMVATGAFQVATVSVSHSGALRAYWSVTLRIIGGLGTTISQLIAPNLEGKFAYNLRINRNASALKVYYQAARLGALLGIFAFIAVLFGCFWVSWSNGAGFDLDIIFIFAIFIFSVSIGVGAILSKFPGLCGAGNNYLILASIKILIAGAVLLLLEEHSLIFALAIIEAIYQSSLIWVVRSNFKAFNQDE